MPQDTAATHTPDELAEVAAALGCAPDEVRVTNGVAHAVRRPATPAPAPSPGLTCDAVTLEGRTCVEPLDQDGACPLEGGHDPSGGTLVEDGTARRLVAGSRTRATVREVLDAADAADPGPDAWRRVVAPDEDDEEDRPADAPPPRPTPRRDDVHDVHPEQAGSPNTLRAVACHRDRHALAEDDRAHYVALSRAHGDIAYALDNPLSSPWAVPAALVAVAAHGLAWLDTLAPGSVLRVVAGERIAQRRKHPEATLDLPGLDEPARFVVLAEEVGEVANALTYDEGDPDNLVRELVQVVALALAWLDGLDDREGTVR